MPAHTRVSTSFAGTEKLSAAFENSALRMTMIRKMNTPHSTPDSRPFLRCLFPQTYPPAYAPIPSAAVDITDSIRSVASILVITYAKASTATNIAPHPTQAEIAVDDSKESFLPPKSLLFFISAPPHTKFPRKIIFTATNNKNTKQKGRIKNYPSFVSNIYFASPS